MANAATMSVGGVLHGRDHEKIGTITDVISDATTMEPAWYEVKIGMLGGRHLVPVSPVRMEGDQFVVPFTKDQVKRAPSVSGPIPFDNERIELCRHYQLQP